MKLATFNVNSVRKRTPHVLRFLERHQPDFLFLQETRCKAEEFPAAAFEPSGYLLHVVGQHGGRNGVALLSRHPFEVTEQVLPGEADDDHARFIGVRAAGMDLAGIYLPNGNSGGAEGYAYKLRWMDRLVDWAAQRLDRFQPTAILGDWNVCPTDADLAPGALPPTDALVRPETRMRFRTLGNLGMTDALAALNPCEAPYTYWDYGAAFNANRGLRIDHILLSAELAERLIDCGVDITARSEEQPSDHAPVWCELR